MRLPAAGLVTMATGLLEGAGLAADRAGIVAGTLVDGDLLGYPSHGLALLPRYLEEIVKGRMRTEGSPEVVRDSEGTLVWDGRSLRGPWLVHQAIGAGMRRARRHGTSVIVIRHSHHIACLMTYLRAVVAENLMIVLASSDPAAACVAPFGGTRRLYSTNPIAAGIPTGGDPILIDIGMASTSLSQLTRHRDANQALPHDWLLDAAGRASADPETYFADPPGSILPLGGLESGYKGFALGLLVEALTSGLAGFGRSRAARGWGANVYLQIIDPERLGGLGPFLRETAWLVEAVHANPPAPGADGPPRLPGERAEQKHRRGHAGGVKVDSGTITALAPWRERYGVELPAG